MARAGCRRYILQGASDFGSIKKGADYAAPFSIWPEREGLVVSPIEAKHKPYPQRLMS